MPIYVTKTTLPHLDEYVRYLEGVWSRGHITNHGPLVLELERRLAQFLGVEHAVLVTNGTLALQLAYEALSLRGEVVTTPFSYVATTSSLVWQKLRPVFADIDRDTLCISPDAVERCLTDATSAIVATHVYGFPCDVEAIASIAQSKGLRVIYDAAHAFGVRYQGESLLRHGHASILSFHATKLFHTVEGGAVVTNDGGVAQRVRDLRNFGHDGPEKFVGLGINGKMCELHAAMGLALLPSVPKMIDHRRLVCERYDALLSGCGAVIPRPRPHTGSNFAYYPVLLEDQETLQRVKASMEEVEVYPRRYFYPSLNQLPYVDRVPCPVAEDVAGRVLCLPLHPALTADEIALVVTAIRRAL